MPTPGAGVLGALTAAGQDRGGSPSFEVLTAVASTLAGNLLQGSGVFAPLTASGTVVGSFNGRGSATFERLTANNTDRRASGGTLELFRALGTGYAGSLSRGVAAFAPFAVAATGSGPVIGRGTSTFALLTAAAAGHTRAYGAGAATLRLFQANAHGLVGTLGRGVSTFELLSASASGYPAHRGTGAATWHRLGAYASGDAAITNARDAWAINTRSGAVTKYPSYPVNSLARYNGTYIGAGPAGIYRLEGDDSVEVASTWRVRTGQLDDKRANLKRITEVLMSLRYDSPATLRIWKDEDTYYDYPLPNLEQDVLQQVRVKTGKGLRSRYYKVEIFGEGGRFEMNSLQATMPDTTRRIG